MYIWVQVLSPAFRHLSQSFFHLGQLGFLPAHWEYWVLWSLCLCRRVIRWRSELQSPLEGVEVFGNLVRPGQFQTGPLGLGPAIEESLGSPAKQEQGSQLDRVCTENKWQYSLGNTQNGVLSRVGLM